MKDLTHVGLANCIFFPSKHVKRHSGDGDIARRGVTYPYLLCDTIRLGAVYRASSASRPKSIIILLMDFCSCTKNKMMVALVVPLFFSL